MLPAGSPRSWWGSEVETANWEFVVSIGQYRPDQMTRGQELLLTGISVERVSRELGFGTPQTFRRAFRRRFGLAPVAWAVKNDRRTRTRTRVREAEILLLETDAAMNEIASRTGFANSPNFTRAFRKIHGIAPSEWRKLRRGDQ